jgi:hypothetical protein
MNTTRSTQLIRTAALVALVVACSPRDRAAPSGNAPGVSTSSSSIASGSSSTTAVDPEPLPTDAWIGQWTGVEGTFLRIDGGNGEYRITIRNLDGPREFAGRAEGNTIRFERDGVRESLHASNGVETGMKWLTEKTDCLTVRAGEGYCRD